MGILSFNLFLWFPQNVAFHCYAISEDLFPRCPETQPKLHSGVVLRSQRLKEISAEPHGSSAQSIRDMSKRLTGPMSHSSSLSCLPPDLPLLGRPGWRLPPQQLFWGGFQSLSSPLINHHSFIPVPQDIIQTPRYFSSLPLYFFARGTNSRKRIPPDKPQGSYLLPDLLNAA